jgi:hypothetical protein
MVGLPCVLTCDLVTMCLPQKLMGTKEPDLPEGSISSIFISYILYFMPVDATGDSIMLFWINEGSTQIMLDK